MYCELEELQRPPSSLYDFTAFGVGSSKRRSRMQFRSIIGFLSNGSSEPASNLSET